MELSIIWLSIAGVIGFALGRASMYGPKEAAERENKTESEHRDNGYRESNVRIPGAWSVGSPVTGRVTAHREGERPTVVIRPDSDRLYAPAGGKVTRLFPMGNAFLFTTEFGAEMHIQVGESEDELLGCYFRPRVLRNEVVAKGKLLLEFDRQALQTERADIDVLVSVENCVSGEDVWLKPDGLVKAGEEILQVRNPLG